MKKNTVCELLDDDEFPLSDEVINVGDHVRMLKLGENFSFLQGIIGFCWG
jgi:hypothetical protein